MKAIWMLLFVFLAQSAFASPKSTVKSITEFLGGQVYKVVFEDNLADKDDVDAAKEEVIRRWKKKNGNKEPKNIQVYAEIGVPDPTAVFVFHK